ncbi:sensor histidine kinase [Nucisporomicrobium flavum]|uniref:sensor histidine kinase n=1 Tax=Nucisporomicrobium flavum TaxID=2785915 RepID=UPI003C30C99E
MLRRRPARPLEADIALTVALLAVTLYEGHHAPPGWRPFDAEAHLLLLAAALPVLTRRYAPAWSLAASGACWMAYVIAGYWPVANVYVYLLILFTVAATRPPRYAAGGVALGIGLWLAGGALTGAQYPLGVSVLSALVPVTVCWAGFEAAQLADRNRRLADATAELTRTQRERALRAATHERMRIARELHDVVGHHLSVISIQTGLAKYVLRSDAETAGTALETIESLTVETLHEMRRILVLLRVGATEAGIPVAGQEPFHPAPGLADLPLLFERVRAAGVELAVSVTGTPRELPSGLELCVYRVVQESLTNVIKHAAPTRARIVLGYGPTTFTARVSDEGPARPDAGTRPPSGAGQGVTGMRERASIYGGTLEAAARRPRGFEVRLTLPTVRRERVS